MCMSGSDSPAHKYWKTFVHDPQKTEIRDEVAVLHVFFLLHALSGGPVA